MSAELPVTPVEKKLLGIPYSDFARLLLIATPTSLIGAILGGFFTFWVFAKEPRLTHVVPRTIAFEGDQKITAIYQVIISNTGNKEAEDVDCFVKVPGANVDDARVFPESLGVTPEKKKDTARAIIKLINKGDRVQMSILASSATALPDSPEVAVRGKGVTSIEESNVVLRITSATTGNVFVDMIFGLILTGIAIATLYYLGRNMRTFANIADLAFRAKRSGGD